VDDYIRFLKTQIGGAWFRVAQNPQTGAWRVVRTPSAVRYDSTDNTLLALIGHQLTEPDHDDAGNILPDGVMVGVAGDCSGGQTPWGTVFSAEENVQDYYGDLEVAWNSNNGFVLGAGFDPGANVVPSVVPGNSGFYYGLLSNSFEKHNRDVYGYLVEIDPGQAPGLYYQSLSTGGDGKGHRKLGVMGRARWENAAFVVGSDWQLLDGKKIVIYGGDDRTSGRIYKWVSAAAYTTGMTKAQVRALLDEGTLYVCDFEDLNNNDGYTLLSTGLPPTEATRGTGRWVELSTTSTDIAPNAAALGDPTRTVGAALTDVNWNSIGGFPDDNTVRQALFTATNKIGAMELNRPEDVEWNALDPSGTPRLYVAFTNHTRRKALDQDGVLIPPAIHGTTPARADTVGRIFALEEANPASPQDSMTFTYFQVWGGSTGQGLFNAADPDNLMIDAAGGLWFGTDGNYGTNGRADAVYYVDLDPAHAAGQPGIVFPTFGLGFRVAAGPADSEATGPCFSSDMRTLFFNAQHPGESVSSTWPQDR
jgi:secreted PhoX family phosphatase